jgi:hypothetical protein
MTTGKKVDAATLNMAIWDRVSTTDPKYTTKVNQRGGFTAIGAQYQLKTATEMFGPIGMGWGVKDEMFDEVGMHTDTGLILYRATFWYKVDEGTEYTFPIHSSIKYAIGGRLDDDFAKKVATDALTKGLSKLGFNADVFMGMFDDNKYVLSLTDNKTNGVAKNPKLTGIDGMTKLSKAQEEQLKKVMANCGNKEVVNKIQLALDNGVFLKKHFKLALQKLETAQSDILVKQIKKLDKEAGDEQRKQNNV